MVDIIILINCVIIHHYSVYKYKMILLFALLSLAACASMVAGIPFPPGFGEGRGGFSSVDVEGAILRMFEETDTDEDGVVSQREMRYLVRKQAPDELKDKIDASLYIKNYDRDGSGDLDLEEFGEAVRPSEDAEFEVKMHDGSTRWMTQKEMAERTAQSTRNMRSENNMLVKDEEGTDRKLEELMQTNPDLARIVIMGRWATSVLNYSGAIPGRLSGMRSLPLRRPGDHRSGSHDKEDAAAEEEGSEQQDYAEVITRGKKAYEVRLMLTFKDDVHKNTSAIEALIRRDPDAFSSPPHLSVLSAHWLLPTTTTTASSSEERVKGDIHTGGGADSTGVQNKAVQRDPKRPPLSIPPQESQAFRQRNDSARPGSVLQEYLSQSPHTVPILFSLLLVVVVAQFLGLYLERREQSQGSRPLAEPAQYPEKADTAGSADTDAAGRVAASTGHKTVASDSTVLTDSNGAESRVGARKKTK